MTEYNPEVYSNMQVGLPYKSYKKVILGQVYVNIIDPFNGQPVGYIIKGDPKTDPCIIDVWTEKEDVFFKRMNKRHFDMGSIVPFERTKEKEESVQPIEQYSDEQLKELLSSKPLHILHELQKVKSEETLSRILNMAKEMEKSEKMIRAIEARLSQIQSAQYEDIGTVS